MSNFKEVGSRDEPAIGCGNAQAHTKIKTLV